MEGFNMSSEDKDFGQTVRGLAEAAIIKIIREGTWVQPSYQNRVQLPAQFMEEVWALVDTDKVKQELAHNIEKELANRLVNFIATELATDIKSVLSVKERREAIRAYVRKNLNQIVKTTEQGGC
jgi:hypothetical protein